MFGKTDAAHNEILDFWNSYYWLAMWASLAIAAFVHVAGHHPVDLLYDLLFAGWTAVAQLLALRWPAHARMLHALSVLPFLGYYCNAPGILVDDKERPMVYILFSFFPIYTASAMAGAIGVALSLALAMLSGTSLLLSSQLSAAIAPIYWGLAAMIGYGHHHLTEALQKQYQRLTTQALSDPLTGLGNRRALERDFNRYRDLAQREGKRLVLTLWDINDLKKINDIHGHAFGDRVIKKFASAVANSARRSDPFYRIGGDEFAGLHIGIDNPNDLIRRIREKSPWISAGWADATNLSFEEAYKKADQNMYTDKSTKPPEPAVFEFDD